MGKIPAAGFVRNPLTELPPNMKCPCGSGVKFKKCCKPLTPYAIPARYEEEWLQTMEVAMDGEVAW